MCFFLPQVRGHSTALSVGPPSPRRETCFATSNFIPGRSLSNVPCAATPADDVTPWAGTCAPILVPASHTLTCEADTVCTCVQYHAGWFLTPSCWFLTPFKSEHMLSLHGSYSNTPPCTLTRLHNFAYDILLTYSWKRTHSLSVHVFHLQTRCTAANMHIISFVWNHLRKSSSSCHLDVVDVSSFGD